MAIINTGTFAKALWPGVNKWYGDAYKEHQVEYTQLFDKFSSSKAYEEDVSISGFGLAQVKAEGSPVLYDTMRQGFTTRYTHVNYAIGFNITREMFDDDQYGVIGKKRAQALAFSMRQTKETVAANVYNRAFTAGYVGGDGVVLCSTAHVLVAGGTASNRPATDVQLSEAALEDALISIMKFTNDRGLRISVSAKDLVVPVDLVFEAERILKSVARVGTANNDLNALKEKGMFPGGIKANHYFTSTTAWFIRTNAPDGMKYFERKADSFDADNDFDTENAKFKASGRYSFGWSDWRQLYGTTGA